HRACKITPRSCTHMIKLATRLALAHYRSRRRDEGVSRQNVAEMPYAATISRRTRSPPCRLRGKDKFDEVMIHTMRTGASAGSPITVRFRQSLLDEEFRCPLLTILPPLICPAALS